jgi:acetyl esterase/lipase
MRRSGFVSLFLAAAVLVPNVARVSGQSSCREGNRGRLLHYERVASYPTAESVRDYFYEWIAFYQDFYKFPPDLPERFTTGFDSYKVTYCTVDALLPREREARPTVVTGIVSVPRATGRLSTVAYQHGTSVSFYDVPSNPNIVGPFAAGGESFEGPPSNAVFAGNGFIYIGPDYVGLGDSSVPRHRYFHAASEASAAVDLLAAADRVLAGLHVQRDGKLFVFGFSQGSHAALALHRELERTGVDVTATATVGGIFDVERWFLSALDNQTTITLPLYMAYILLAYDDTYDVYRRKTDVFRQPYAWTVADLFDMKHFFDDVLAGMPSTTRKLLTPSFAANLASDPENPLRVRLRQNAVDRWRPRAPVRHYQSPDDEEAPYDDALRSMQRLRKAGADVTVRVLPGFDHINSWIQAMPRAVTWFRSLAGR